jgi:hypothetical protein
MQAHEGSPLDKNRATIPHRRGGAMPQAGALRPNMR